MISRGEIESPVNLFIKEVMRVRSLFVSYLLKDIKVENVSKAICIDHDPLDPSADHSHGDHQGVVVIMTLLTQALTILMEIIKA